MIEISRLLDFNHFNQQKTYIPKLIKRAKDMSNQDYDMKSLVQKKQKNKDNEI